jgi:hypothetical protein
MKNKEISNIVDQLVYEALVSDKVSVDWCPDFERLKVGVSAISLQSSMSTLILHDQKIGSIDKKFAKRFKGLKSLALTGNFLQNIDNLPSGVEILHLNANKLKEFPDQIVKLAKILHVGLAFNSIQVLGIQSNQSLVSLDLSYNQLYNIEEVIIGLKGFANLKCLNLIGNPIGLGLGYPSAIYQGLPQLRYFDGCEIIALKYSQPVQQTNTIKMNVLITKLSGISLPSVNTADGTGYTLSAFLNEIPTVVVTTSSKGWSPDEILFHHCGSISFAVQPTSVNVLKKGLTLILNCDKYASEKPSKKGAKTAITSTFSLILAAERKIISTELLHSCQLSLNIAELTGGSKRSDLTVPLGVGSTEISIFF